MLRISALFLLLGLVAAACGSGGPSPEELTPGPPTTDLHLTAKNFKFDRRALSAPANTQVSLTFSNQDSGALHNVSFYTDKNAKQKIYGTELNSGKRTDTATFRTPAPGAYYFRCDAHTDMNGTLFAQ